MYDWTNTHAQWLLHYNVGRVSCGNEEEVGSGTVSCVQFPVIMFFFLMEFNFP